MIRTAPPVVALGSVTVYDDGVVVVVPPVVSWTTDQPAAAAADRGRSRIGTTPPRRLHEQLDEPDRHFERLIIRAGAGPAVGTAPDGNCVASAVVP
jgi:hypothetical protein